jgi:Lrp/AsnC ligand binding domain
MIAYIFVTCVPGQERDVISKIKRFPHVVEVNGIMGSFDIFIKVSARNNIELHATITNIRDVQSITSTSTFTAIGEEGKTVDQEK